MLDKDSKVLEFLPNEPQNKGPIPQFYGHLVFTTLFAQAYIKHSCPLLAAGKQFNFFG